MRTNTIFGIIENININNQSLATLLIDIKNAYGNDIFMNALDIIVTNELNSVDEIDESTLFELINKDYKYDNLKIKDYRVNNLTKLVEVKFTYNEKCWYKTENPDDTDSYWRKTDEYQYSRISDIIINSDITYPIEKCLK